MVKLFTRREFVQTTAVAAAAVTIAPASGYANASPYDSKGLPIVTLGNTGAKVPVMGFRCGSRWMTIQEDNKALEILQYALN